MSRRSRGWTLLGLLVPWAGCVNDVGDDAAGDCRQTTHTCAPGFACRATPAGSYACVLGRDAKIDGVEPDSTPVDARAPEPDAALAPDRGETAGGGRISPHDALPPLPDGRPPFPDLMLPVFDAGSAGDAPTPDAQPEPPPAPDAALEPPPSGDCPEADPVCAPAPAPLCEGQPCVWQPPLGERAAPAARLTAVGIPTSARCAAAIGCRLEGFTNGTGLAGLVPLAIPDARPPAGDCEISDLGRLVQPDAAGEIQWLTLAVLAGLVPGDASGATGPLALPVYGGLPRAGGDFDIDPATLDAAGAPAYGFPDVRLAANGRVTSGPGRFHLPLGELILDFPISGAHVSGFVEPGPNDAGFQMGQALIGGYMTTADMTSMLLAAQERCAAPDSPAFCATLSGLLPPGSCTAQDCEAGVGLIASFVGGLDARLDDDGGTQPCNPNVVNGGCNAVGVCLQVTFSPATIAGVAR